MLVLSRKRGESILIGENVEVVIAEVRGNKVRIGINAPKSVPVYRKEVYKTIAREKAKAVTV